MSGTITDEQVQLRPAANRGDIKPQLPAWFTNDKQPLISIHCAERQSQHKMRERKIWNFNAPTCSHNHIFLREGNRMRMLLRVSIPVDAGNAAAKAGTLGSTVERILSELKPEAAYFFAGDDGQRSGSIVFDMKDSSEIPAIAEPWFLAFNAKISLRPVMNPQDLATAGPSIGKAAEQYGK